MQSQSLGIFLIGRHDDRALSQSHMMFGAFEDFKFGVVNAARTIRGKNQRKCLPRQKRVSQRRASGPGQNRGSGGEKSWGHQ